GIFTFLASLLVRSLLRYLPRFPRGGLPRSALPCFSPPLRPRDAGLPSPDDLRPFVGRARVGGWPSRGDLPFWPFPLRSALARLGACLSRFTMRKSSSRPSM